MNYLLRTVTLAVALTLSASAPTTPTSASPGHLADTAAVSVDHHRHGPVFNTPQDLHHPHDSFNPVSHQQLPDWQAPGSHTAHASQAPAEAGTDGVVSFGMVFTVELPPFIVVGNKKYRLSIRMPGASGVKAQ